MPGTAGPTNSMWIVFEGKRARSSPKTGSWSNSLSGPVQISSPQMFGMSAPEKCSEFLNGNRNQWQIQRLSIATYTLLKKVWRRKESLLGFVSACNLVHSWKQQLKLQFAEGILTPVSDLSTALHWTYWNVFKFIPALAYYYYWSLSYKLHPLHREILIQPQTTNGCNWRIETHT